MRSLPSSGFRLADSSLLAVAVTRDALSRLASRQYLTWHIPPSAMFEFCHLHLHAPLPTSRARCAPDITNRTASYPLPRPNEYPPVGLRPGGTWYDSAAPADDGLSPVFVRRCHGWKPAPVEAPTLASVGFGAELVAPVAQPGGSDP